MSSEKSIELLYKIFKSKFGEAQTIKSISTIFSVVLHRISEEGLPHSEEQISKKLSEIANDYLEASNSEVA